MNAYQVDILQGKKMIFLMKQTSNTLTKCNTVLPWDERMLHDFLRSTDDFSTYLLMFPVMPRYSAMCSLWLNRLAVRWDQDTGHKTEWSKSLCESVWLHISIVVFASPDKSTSRFQSIGNLENIWKISRKSAMSYSTFLDEVTTVSCMRTKLTHKLRKAALQRISN